MFRTSRVPVLTVHSEFVIPSHPVCAGFTLEKGAPESRSGRVMSYTRGVVQVRSCCFGCVVASGPHPLRRCTAAVPGTKTPCRTITLNKSLYPIAIRRGVLSAGCLYRRSCLNKIKTTAATVVRPSSGIHRPRRRPPRLLKISKAIQLSRSVKWYDSQLLTIETRCLIGFVGKGIILGRDNFLYYV